VAGPIFGGEALVAAACTWLLKKVTTKERSMEYASKCVLKTLSKKYEAPNRKIDKLPIITRPNQDRLNQLFASRNSSITLFAGPSRSGKSALTSSLVNGRTATVFFVGREMKSDERLPSNIAIMFGLTNFLDIYPKGMIP
jgi:hypothetical protein